LLGFITIAGGSVGIAKIFVFRLCRDDQRRNFARKLTLNSSHFAAVSVRKKAAQP